RAPQPQSSRHRLAQVDSGDAGEKTQATHRCRLCHRAWPCPSHHQPTAGPHRGVGAGAGRRSPAHCRARGLGVMDLPVGLLPTDSPMRDNRSCYLDNEPDGGWTKEQLEAMDACFVAVLERAFELRLENRESARREIKVPSGPIPRTSWPLPPTIWCALLR